MTSYVLRFVNNFKAKYKSGNGLSDYDFVEGDLQLNELEVARSLWIRSEQKDVIQNHKRFKELKCALGLYVDDEGILRLRGRLENITGEFSQKFPIFLDCKRYFSELIILESHKKVKHNRVKDTLNELRSAYWITQGKRTVTRVIARCALCRAFDAMAFQLLPFAPLPAFRVQADFPFTNTGVDYFGPLFVKNIFPTNANPPLTDMYKVHVVLYTCASSRAVHLDVVPDPSCSAFVRSAKRFSSRYGVPRMYISDNATCFTGPELTEYLQVMGSKWEFILEASPWWGGFWERLVQSTKRCLRKCLGRAKLSYEELLTLLAEIECVLNSRPLCHIPEDSTDEVITPSHLLLGRRLLSPRVDVDLPEEDLTGPQVGKRLAYLNRLLEHFWSRWSHEYLTELRQHQNCHNRVPNRQVKLGDVVLIHDDLPRNRWKMGVVSELFTGRDGFVRGCQVRTLTPKTRRITHLNRPVNKLYPLEIQSYQESDLSTNVPASNEDAATLASTEDAIAPDLRISERRKRLQRTAAESGILKRIIEKQV